MTARVIVYWLATALALATFFIVFGAFPRLINSQNDGEIIFALLAVGFILTSDYFFYHKVWRPIIIEGDEE